MKLLLVRPQPSAETIGLQHLMIVEPLELEILSALKRECDTAIVVDMILEKKPIEFFLEKHQPDVLCITGYITNVSTIISYCQQAKQIDENIVTVVGGVHCEVCPEDFDDLAVDYRVVRNATTVFSKLLNHIDNNAELPAGVFRKGDTLENYLLPEFDFTVPFPDRDIVAKYRKNYFYIFYDKVALLKTSFGCPYQCSFCFCRIITADKFHQRSVEDVIAELEQIDESEIYIVDDDFLFDVKWLQSFIKEVKNRNIKKHYLVYGRADFIACNPELMHELAEIGLRTVIVGFESFSDKELNSYNKKTSVEMYKKTMQVLQQEKLDVFATIIISPDWDKNNFRNMVKVLKELKIHYVNLQPLTPLPKTGVSYPESEIVIAKNNYPHWDLAHVTVKPSKLTIPQFYQEILNAYNSILYSPGVLWSYFTTYKPAMLLKMLVGGYRVAKQYKSKIKEAKKYA